MATRTLATRAALAVDAAPGTALLTRLSGLVCPYNVVATVGAFTEEVAPGCFAASIRETPGTPLHLFHGDVPGQSDSTPWPIGVADEWRDRPAGLFGSWRLDSSAEAQEAARMARDGLLSYLSVRFNPDPDGSHWTWRGDHQHVRRVRARLVSVSLTSVPAYTAVAVSDVRTVDQAERAAQAAHDKVVTLGQDLGTDLVLQAITGTASDVSLAADLVWSAIEVHGATDAVPEFHTLAEQARRTGRARLALNLERAAGCVDRDQMSAQLRDAHADRYLTAAGLPRRSDTPPAPARRPRRRRVR